MSEPTVHLVDLSPDLHPDDVLQRITQAFENLADDETYREDVSRVVPGTGVVYGVRVPQLRQMAKQIIKVLGNQPETIKEIANQSWQVGSREHCVLAILILSDLKSLTPAQRWELGKRYLPDVADWESCDHLCMGLLGQALAEEPRYMGELEIWVDDPNFWVRRAALASTVILRRAKVDEETLRLLDQRALGICYRLLNDEEHYVRKAVDWAVREVIRRDYTLGEAWMLERGKEPLSSVARSTLKKSAKKLKSEAQKLFLEMLQS